MFDKIELFVKECIQGRRQGVFVEVVKSVLLLLSFVFKIGATLRGWAYDFRIISQKHVPAFVVSIGNIVAGGTGKTPSVIMLAEEIQDHHKIGILLRGYRSLAEKNKDPVLVTKHSSAQEVGDEALLLARCLPEALVIVCRDRKKGADFAIQKGASFILLDDGMQHRRLMRDIEIIVVDAKEPFGNGYFLPRGFLREAPSSLKRADLLILTHCNNAEEVYLAEQKIRKYSEAPIVYTRPSPQGFYSLQDQEMKLSLQGKKVGIVSAIAHPEKFKALVESMGIYVVDELIAMDHRSFSEESLRQFAYDASQKGAEILLCTEKDRVKMRESFKLLLPLAWIKMKLEILQGKEYLNLEKLKNKQKNK